jgi:hypothetical protein
MQRWRVYRYDRTSLVGPEADRVSMRESSQSRRWTRHFVYRTQCTRTTWKFRAALAMALLMVVWLARGWLSVTVARGVVCNGNRSASDAILVENFDPDYLLFERARELREAGLAARVLVPVPRDENTSEWQGVALATTELLAKLARVGTIELIPIREVEPISLNAARDVLRFIERERIHSVLVVSPVFRSRRSALVYGSTLGQAGVVVNCEPVQGLIGVDNWGSTWHGIQNVVEQWGKLQYYRFYVLKFRLHGTEQPSR